MRPQEQLTRRDRLVGCLLGAAVGDAVGLPFEGLSSMRRERLFGEVRGYRFLAQRGMGSDDTEHAIHTARALLASNGDVDAFRRHLANSLRMWFLCLPAGIGLATLKACLRLLVGVPPDRSGVRSAGNGPAMRSAIIGVFQRDDRLATARLVEASTRLTHTDPLAETGALLVAHAAAHSGDAAGFIADATVAVASADPRWVAVVQELGRSLELHASTRSFARAIGCEDGVSGFILHSVPVALHAALSATTVSEAVIAAVECGGDTDTTGSIAGAIAGARLGPDSIPADWRARWADFPITIARIEMLAGRMAIASGPETVGFPWWWVPPRNLLFLVVVLGHALRRLLPPW